jgi:hypothetical protein
MFFLSLSPLTLLMKFLWFQKMWWRYKTGLDRASGYLHCKGWGGGEEWCEKQKGNLLAAFRVRVAQLCGTGEIIAILFDFFSCSA